MARHTGFLRELTQERSDGLDDLVSDLLDRLSADVGDVDGSARAALAAALGNAVVRLSLEAQKRMVSMPASCSVQDVAYTSRIVAWAAGYSLRALPPAVAKGMGLEMAQATLSGLDQGHASLKAGE